MSAIGGVGAASILLGAAILASAAGSAAAQDIRFGPVGDGPSAASPGYDRSFIRDIESSRDDAEIIRAIVSMAHSLKLQVTAEGVETRAQHEFLRTLGCEQYQGFFCNPPLPADRFIETLGAEEPAHVSATQRLRTLGRIARNRLLPGGAVPET